MRRSEKKGGAAKPTFGWQKVPSEGIAAICKVQENGSYIIHCLDYAQTFAPDNGLHDFIFIQHPSSHTNKRYIALPRYQGSRVPRGMFLLYLGLNPWRRRRRPSLSTVMNIIV